MIDEKNETAHIDCLDPFSERRMDALKWECENARCTKKLNIDGLKYCRNCGARRGEKVVK